MAPRLSRTALAAALLGLAAADVDYYQNAVEYDALVKSSHGAPQQTFRSSDIIAPIFQVNTLNLDAVDDAPYIFMGSVFGEDGHESGPMIFNATDLSLVYSDPHYDNSYCSNVQIIDGKRYLYFWQGERNRGHSPGHILFYDEQYNLAYTVSSVGDNIPGVDAHEAYLTPDETVVYSVYFNRVVDLTSVGGKKDGSLYDSGFQEVDIKTNKLIFEWTASQSFPVTDSYDDYKDNTHDGKNPYDFAHVNSVEKTEDGNYLVSSRHLSQLTLLNGKTGQPIWVLGGKQNQFKDLSDGRATDFGFQHSARFFDNQSHIVMFDNHGTGTGTCGSPDARFEDCLTRILHLEINTDDMTVREVSSFYHPENINSGAMGGTAVLDNGNILTAWGDSAGFVEYTADGTPVLDYQKGSLPHRTAYVNAYRVFKGEWSGKPSWSPSAAVDAPDASSHNGVVYLSWNGATALNSWMIVAADDPADLSNPEFEIASSARHGFETTISLGADHEARRYIAAAAKDRDGNIIGSTVVIDMSTGKLTEQPSNIAGVSPAGKSFMTTTKALMLGAVVICVALTVAVGIYSCRRRGLKPDIEQTKYQKVERTSTDDAFDPEALYYDDGQEHGVAEDNGHTDSSGKSPAKLN